MMQKLAVTRAPSPVSITQRPAASSKARRLHARVELDVAAQVEAVGDVVGVAQDLGLGGVALAPLPLLLQLVGELVGVLHALDVAARARIAVPVPGAADAAAGLEHARREAHAAQPVQHVDAGEAGADDHRVKVGFMIPGVHAGLLPNVVVAGRSSPTCRRTAQVVCTK